MRTLKTLALIVSATAALFTLTSCDGGYGEKMTFEKGDLYYTDAVEKEEVEKLGEWLVEQEFFDGKEKSVQLDKDGDKYQFRMVVMDSFLEDKAYETTAALMATNMESSVFEGKDVELHLCNDTFETQKVVQAIDLSSTEEEGEEESPEKQPAEGGLESPPIPGQ